MPTYLIMWFLLQEPFQGMSQEYCIVLVTALYAKWMWAEHSYRTIMDYSFISTDIAAF